MKSNKQVKAMIEGMQNQCYVFRNEIVITASGQVYVDGIYACTVSIKANETK